MINQYKSKDNTLYDIHDKRLPENLDAGKVVKVNSAGTGFEYGEAGGGESKLVEVTYGVTTYNEVKAIVDSGKLPYFYIENRRYDLNNYDTGSYIGYFFTCPYSNVSRYAYITTSGWGTGSTSLETLTNKKSTINPTSTTEYPSSKAVADYVAQHSGGGWTLLWENASPSSSFASQSISLNSSNYSKIAISMKSGLSFIYDKSGGSTFVSMKHFTSDDPDSIDFYIRRIPTLTNDTITFEDCKHIILDFDGVGEKLQSNANLVPYKIYGFN